MKRWSMKAPALAVLLAAATLLSVQAFAQDKSIVVASTTSTQDSGLFGYLLPMVKQRLGIEVKVLAQGTGQALDTARRGDADVVFVHAKSAEEKFLAEGYGVRRYPVMYNDFVVIGPKSDPAGIKGKDVAAALQTIKAKAAPFVSRGDRSGTHIAELALWKQAGIDIATDKGNPVYATADGTVASAGPAGEYGNLIVLEHDFGLSTRYGHLSRFNVRSGQHVARGAVIGFVGSTGRSTGAHLHYEILANGRQINPLQLLTQAATR